MRIILHLILLLNLAIVNMACTSAINLKAGIYSFHVQDYRQAFIRLFPEAQKGQPDAQYAIGFMYYYGQGIIEDRKKACEWIHKAAQAGQRDAIAALKLIDSLPPYTNI